MKKIILIFITLFMISIGYSQKVAIVGTNHVSLGAPNDGFTFVAIEDIPAGEEIYFTDNEYMAGSNAFTFNGYPIGEAVIKYVVGSGGLNKGVVVFMNEINPDVFEITCSSVDCGSATTSNGFGNGSFNLATNGDALYAYSDTDEDAVNGITQVYSVLFTGSGEFPLQNGGAIPAGVNPISDFPNAVVVNGFTDDGDYFAGPDRVEYVFDPASLRENVGRSDLENVINWLEGQNNGNLSLVPFTNIFSGVPPVITCPADITVNNDLGQCGAAVSFAANCYRHSGANHKLWCRN